MYVHTLPVGYSTEFTSTVSTSTQVPKLYNVNLQSIKHCV